MWRLAGIYSAVGMEMALGVGLGTFAGVAVDDGYGVAPWGALVGFAIGVGAAALAVWRALRLGRRAMANLVNPSSDAGRPDA